jgi:hypothetical protein
VRRQPPDGTVVPRSTPFEPPTAGIAVGAVAAGKTYFAVKAVPSAEAGKTSPLPAGALGSAALTDHEREAGRDLVRTMRKLL